MTWQMLLSVLERMQEGHAQCDCEWCFLEKNNPLWFIHEIIGEA
jgi:hypothetical protein